MKFNVVFILFLQCCFLTGCSHIHTISMPGGATSKLGPNAVDLTSFWRDHGFTLVEPTSEFGKMRYHSEDGSEIFAVWEKWFKGTVFKYSGGMWATEEIKGDEYVVTFLPTPSRDGDTQKMAFLLKEYLEKNFPDAHASINSKAFVDLR